MNKLKKLTDAEENTIISLILQVMEKAQNLEVTKTQLERLLTVCLQEYGKII